MCQVYNLHKLHRLITISIVSKNTENQVILKAFYAQTKVAREVPSPHPSAVSSINEAWLEFEGNILKPGWRLRATFFWSTGVQEVDRFHTGVKNNIV